MNRSKVIVHMYVSIDGKIDGDYSRAASSSYYNDELFKLSNADANGRMTIQMYATPGEVDLMPYSGQGIKYEDWIPNNLNEKYWSISFDRKSVV